MLESENYDRPLYIRIGRSIDPIVHNKPISFKIGKAIQINDGRDGALFATGTMVKDAVKTCEILKEIGISLALYSMHTIKPIDEELIDEVLNQYDALFTLEEHSVVGGLGSAVCEILASRMHKKNIRFQMFGFPDMFAPVTGTREYLNQLYEIDPENLAERIKKILR